MVTGTGNPQKAARIAGRELEPLLKRLLSCIAEVEADGWDTDWVRLPKRYASAVLTDIEAALVEPRTAHDAARRVELLGSELALRRWVAGDSHTTEFDGVASQLLEPLSKYRSYLRALSSGGPAT
jgi:hypothetical protein